MTSYGSTGRGADPGDKSSDQIQREVETSRERIGATLDAIQERLSPGQLVDEMLNWGRRSGVGGLGSNLGQLVRENPMPLALIGAGVAWLVLGNRSGGNDDWAGGGHGRGTSGRTYGRGAIDLDEGESSGLGGRAREAGRATADAARRMADRAGETMGGIGERVGDLSESARRKVGELGEAVSGYGESARRRIGDLGESVGGLGESARQSAERARQAALRTREAFDEMLTEHPLVLGGIGVALGAALGSLLPATAREDEYLGPVSDRLRDQAGAAGDEALETAREAAGAAVREAERTVERKLDEVAPEAGSEGERRQGTAGEGWRQEQGTGTDTRTEDTDPLRSTSRSSTVRL
jgi:ElaB/YqjD/DUF883 family membrane-anchored ribosome-binding protein